MPLSIKIRILFIKLRNAWKCLTASRLLRALIELQTSAFANGENDTELIYTEGNVTAHVSIIQAGCNLGECLFDFSKASGEPIENIDIYFNEDSWLYVYDLYVPRKLRRHGIGTLLLDIVTEQAQRCEAHMLLAISKPSRKLHRFYTKNDFEQISPTIYFKRYDLS